MKYHILYNHNKYKGFNLLESIIAMLILALMSFALIFLFILSYGQTAYQSQIMIATDLAIEQLELIKLTNYDEIKTGSEDSVAAYPDFKRTWLVEENFTSPNLKRITVIIEKKSPSPKPIKVQLVLYINKG